MRVHRTRTLVATATTEKPESRPLGMLDNNIRAVQHTAEVGFAALLEPRQNPDWQIDSSCLRRIQWSANYERRLAKFQQSFGLEFRNVWLLKRALMHHSFIHSRFHDTRGIEMGRLSNRTFEFLGDSVLGLTATSFVFQAYPSYTEGKTSRLGNFGGCAHLFDACRAADGC